LGFFYENTKKLKRPGKADGVALWREEELKALLLTPP
jgi:hypothetical protein